MKQSGKVDSNKTNDKILLTEIFDQKKSILNAATQDDRKLEIISKLLRKSKRIFILGSGTSNIAGRSASIYLSRIAAINSTALVSSEFENYIDLVDSSTTIIALSHSGETKETYKALQLAKKKKAKTIAIVNNYNSSIREIADEWMLTNIGQVSTSISTKAYTAQNVLIYLLSMYMIGKYNLGMKKVEDLSKAISKVLTKESIKHIQNLAKKVSEKKSLYIVGKAINYPTALESAMKLKEIAKIHAEGFAIAELQHGPLSLMKKGDCVIVFVSFDKYLKEVQGYIKQFKEKGLNILGISYDNNDDFNEFIKLEKIGMLSSILNIIPIQVMAFFISEYNNTTPNYQKV